MDKDWITNCEQVPALGRAASGDLGYTQGTSRGKGWGGQAAGEGKHVFQLNQLLCSSKYICQPRCAVREVFPFAVTLVHQTCFA